MSSKLTPGFYTTGVQYRFEDFVEFQVACSSNDFSDGFHLDLCLTPGFYELPVTVLKKGPKRFFWLFGKPKEVTETHTFRVRLMQCRIRYDLSGCSIPTKSKYRYSVQTGNLSIEVQERFSASTKFTASASMGLDAKISTTHVAAGMEARATADVSADSKANDESESKIKPEIAIVEHCPFGWTVGVDYLGDPLQLTTGYCLSGSYFIQNVPGYDHTCRVNFDEKSSSASLGFEISVRDGFRVERTQGGKPSLSDSDEKVQVVEAMRQKLAGMVLEKQLAANKNITNENGEIVLVRYGAVAHRDASGETQLPLDRVP